VRIRAGGDQRWSSLPRQLFPRTPFQDNYAPSMEAVSGGRCGGFEGPPRRGAGSGKSAAGQSGGRFGPTLATVVGRNVREGVKKRGRLRTMEVI